MGVIYSSEDAPYIPLPNRVEVVLCDEPSPEHLTSTAFLIPVTRDGKVVLAHNVRRGPEMPGGHIEPGESPLQAAIREAIEETGCSVEGVRPLGYLRMVSHGAAPEGWPYPHPVSYQQVFCGLVTDMAVYQPNDECHAPVIMAWGETKSSIQGLCLRAIADMSE